VTFTTVIAACAAARDAAAALSILAVMRASSVPVTTRACNAALSACERAGCWQAALKLLAEMETKSVGPPPDAVSVRTVVFACCSASPGPPRVKEAKALFRRCVSSPYNWFVAVLSPVIHVARTFLSSRHADFTFFSFPTFMPGNDHQKIFLAGPCHAYRVHAATGMEGYDHAPSVLPGAGQVDAVPMTTGAQTQCPCACLWRHLYRQRCLVGDGSCLLEQ
jgi:pentatricopeptide repeat protein